MSVRKKGKPRGLIAKIRKPTAPPMRVAEDESKYSRKREAERLRRQPPNGSNGGD